MNTEHRPHQSLPTFIMRLLHEGHDEPHRALYAICKSCVINGWSEPEAFALLINSMHVGGKTVQDSKNPLSGHRRFTRAWDKAAKSVQSRVRPTKPDAFTVFADLSAIALAADAVCWPGRSGPTDRLVLDGLLARAWACVRTDGIRLGVRQLADQIGVSKTQAANALARLVAGPFVTRERLDQGYQYALQLPSTDSSGEVPTGLLRLSLRGSLCAPGTQGNLERGGFYLSQQRTSRIGPGRTRRLAYPRAVRQPATAVRRRRGCSGHLHRSAHHLYASAPHHGRPLP